MPKFNSYLPSSVVQGKCLMSETGRQCKFVPAGYVSAMPNRKDIKAEFICEKCGKRIMGFLSPQQIDDVSKYLAKRNV